MTRNDSGPYHKKIWKSKIPAKIKKILWLMMNNAILTKDNLLKRKWSGDPHVIFVIVMKLFHISSFNVALLNLFGQ